MNTDHPKIVLLYQSLLGIYGDHGNAVVLTTRLQWRGIDAELLTVAPGQPVPTDGAVYLLGGGEDTAQITAVQELEADGGLFTALDDGAATASDRGCANRSVMSLSLRFCIVTEVR